MNRPSQQIKLMCMNATFIFLIKWAECDLKYRPYLSSLDLNSTFNSPLLFLLTTTKRKVG